MPRIAVLDDYQNVARGLADWNQLPAGWTLDVFNRQIVGEAAVADALADHEVVVIMRERTPIPASLIDRLPKLRLLVTSGPRNASIDLKAAAAKGVVVCGTDSMAHPPMEIAWALIFALMRQVPREDRAMREGRWQLTVGRCLKGRILGLAGLGKLGGAMVPVAKALGMQVIAWSENLTAERAAEAGAERVDKDALFRESDIVSVHLLLSPRTRGLIGAREIGLMRPDAYLVNTSRGPIVDETAMIEALRGGRIAGAGLDVFDLEPLPKDHPLLKLENTVLTPHLGYVSEENYRNYYGQGLEDILAWIGGKPVRVIAPPA